MKTAIVSLIIGTHYKNFFFKYVFKTWNEYCKNHKIDIILYDEHLDSSDRALSRSPAWQKCLILSQQEVKKYDQVCWLDADIIINPCSPNIFSNVPIEKIGVVDEYSTPTREDQINLRQRWYNFWDEMKIKYIKDFTPTDYYNNFGFKGTFNNIVQTGVLVLSPKYHKDILEFVYYNYEDKGEAYWHYEMRPLGYEILRNNLQFWISPKFNMLWSAIKFLYYPFLNYEKMVTPLYKYCLKNSLDINYFLHFAGCSHEITFFQ